MDIQDNRCVNTQLVSEVKAGTVFRVGDNYYMKVNENQLSAKMNTVCLTGPDTGNLIKMADTLEIDDLPKEVLLAINA